MINIQSTTNYSQFEFIEGNRAIGKFNNLLQSVKNHNKLAYHPIHVAPMHNGKYWVVDGQHRLECAKILKVPIYYMVDQKAKIDDITHLNANMKPWTSQEFVHLYCTKGVEEYIFIQRMVDTYKFDYYFTVYACSINESGTCTKKRHVLVDEYKNGKVKFNLPEGTLENNIKHLREIIDFSKRNLGYKYYNTIFQFSLLHIVARPKYDHEHMMRKIEMHIDQFRSVFASKDKKFIEENIMNNVYNKRIINNRLD